MDNSLLILMYELSECLVDGRLILVILIEEEARNICAEVYEIHE
jgi:hypothetical protein